MLNKYEQNASVVISDIINEMNICAYEFYSGISFDEAILSDTNIDLLSKMSSDQGDRRLERFVLRYKIDAALQSDINGFYSEFLNEKLGDSHMYEYFKLIDNLEDLVELNGIEDTKNSILASYESKYSALEKIINEKTVNITGLSEMNLEKEEHIPYFDKLIDMANAFLSNTEYEYKALQKRSQFGQSRAGLMKLSRMNYLKDISIEHIRKCVAKTISNYKATSSIEIEDLAKWIMPSLNGVCIPLIAQNKIKILLGNHDGFNHMETFLHEMGHAIAYSNLSSEATEIGYHIDNISLQEAYAYLFQSIAYNTEFLISEFNINDDELNGIRFKELYTKRILSTKFLYQHQYNQMGTVDEKKKCYVELFENGLNCSISAMSYQMDANIGNKIIHRFIGLALSELIKSKLLVECDNKWWLSIKNQILLKNMFALGSDLDVKETFF